jgi:hypothetical protein
MSDDATPEAPEPEREIGATPGHVLGSDDQVLEALEQSIDLGERKQELFEGRPLTPAETERERQFMSRVCEEIDIRLRRDHSMRCPTFFIEANGFGYRFHCYDKEERLYIVDYRTEWALELPSAKSGGETIGREMIADIIERVLKARDSHFARMVS